MVEMPPARVAVALTHGTCGCYLLLWQGEVVYVGQSINVFARISSHYANWRRVTKGKKPYLDWSKIIRFDGVTLVPCAKEDLNKVEWGLIQEHSPKHNVRDRPNPERPRPKLDSLQSIVEHHLLRRKRNAEPGLRGIRGLHAA